MLSKNLIGIDIDETLVFYKEPFFSFVCDLNNTFCNSSIGYNFSKSLKINQEEVNYFVKEFEESIEFKHQESLPYARKALQILSKDYKIALITSRSESIRNITLNMLKRNFPDIKFESIHFCNTHVYSKNKKTKRQICEELNLYLFIDDLYSNCKEVSYCCNTILFGDKHYENSTSKNMVFKKTWYDVISFMYKICIF